MITKLFYYLYHKILKLLLPLIRITFPKLIQGEESVFKIKDLLKPNYLHPLIVCSPSILKNLLLDSLLDDFKNNNIEYSIYSNVKPNPTTSLVYEGRDFFINNKCDSIISIGGGSAIDLAKIIGLLITNNKENILDYKGLLKVKKKPIFHIAIPTTVGSGSEASVAAVIIDEKNNDKFAISDPKLVPDVALLDSRMLVNLPKDIIATTGMDALTHAIESLIGRVSNKFITKTSLKSVKLIYDNLFNYYQSGDIEYCKNMQLASYYAGVSFTRGFVGYVHALSHSLSGEFNLPHGYANAILLPVVLEYYGKSIYKKLSLVSDYLNLIDKNSSKKDKAKAIINWIYELNNLMGIPRKFSLCIKEDDIKKLVFHSLKEANPSYPVPKVLSSSDLSNIYHLVI